MSLSGNNFIILAVLVFLAVLLLLEGGYLMWKAKRGPEARKVQQRLHTLSASRDHTPEAKVLKQRMLDELPFFEQLMESVPRVRGLDRLILQSGLQWTVSRLMLYCLFAAIAGWLLLTVGARQSPAMGMLFAMLTALVPVGYVAYKRERRLAKIDQQLPDALDLIGRALRAGHAFSSSLKMAGEELPDPIRGEFRATHDEINFGVSMQQALTNMGDRLPSADVRYFIVAVLIQRESGGNLTEILGNLSELIRNRLKLMSRIRVLSSEGRLSAWILVVMPFFIAAVLNLVNPKFMSPLWTDPIGQAIVKWLLIMMVIGIVIMRKIVQIRV